MKKERAAGQPPPQITATLTPAFLVKDPPPLMTLREVAAWLRVCPRKVNHMMSRGEIPFIKLGNGRNSAVRFRRSDMETALGRMAIV